VGVPRGCLPPRIAGDKCDERPLFPGNPAIANVHPTVRGLIIIPGPVVNRIPHSPPLGADDQPEAIYESRISG
jgi:hypothetical protein